MRGGEDIHEDVSDAFFSLFFYYLFLIISLFCLLESISIIIRAFSFLLMFRLKRFCVKLVTLNCYDRAIILVFSGHTEGAR